MSETIKDDDGKYRFTSDYVFMVEPILENVKKEKHLVTNNSPFLYIRKEEYNDIIQNRPINHIDYTPLKKLIENGFIEKDKDEPEIKKTFFKTRTKNYNYEYYKCKFHRTLTDEIYGKDDDYVNNNYLKNENDCLSFSECMTVANYKPDTGLFDRMIGVIDVTEKEEQKKGKGGIEPALQVKGTTNIFGVTDKKNIALSKKYPEDDKDHKANPAVGESYAIININKKDNDGSNPYHIGFVLCKDNNLNITIEAFADQGTDFVVKFSIYDTKDPLYTFHSSYKMLFDNSTTIILESRDLNDPETGLIKIESDIAQRQKEYNDKLEEEKKSAEEAAKEAAEEAAAKEKSINATKSKKSKKPTNATKTKISLKKISIKNPKKMRNDTKSKKTIKKISKKM
jgi:hypothetical protein